MPLIKYTISLLPRVYVEHTVQNPTYDIEEGQPSDTSDKVKEPIELYEEIPPEEGTSNLEEFEDNDVYDVPEALDSDQLEAYATTDVPGEKLYETAYATTDVSGEEMFQAYAATDVSGGDMLKAYAITDVTQNERMCNAYAVTDVPEGRLGSGSQQVVSAEVHADKSNMNESKVRANTNAQTTPRRIPDTTMRVKNIGVQLPTLTAPQKDANDNKDRARVKAANIPPTKQQKEGSKPTNKASLKGKPMTALKPALHPKPAGAKDKPGSETSKKVKFEDEDRRRSKSYTGAHWESVAQEEQSNKSSTKSSIKGKPKLLPKKKGINLMRNRGASDSGVEGYSKLDLKSQYASLEPHMKQETNGKDGTDAKTMQDSYSHLKH